MPEDLQRQLREVEEALAAIEGVIAVRQEYVSLLGRIGSREREVAGLTALVEAASRLQALHDGLVSKASLPDA
jgi:hypothetical protein